MLDLHDRDQGEVYPEVNTCMKMLEISQYALMSN